MPPERPKQAEVNEDLPDFSFEDEYEDLEEETETPEGDELNEGEEADDIIRKLTEVEKKANDAGTLAKILADPDVRALLQAKEQGKKVKVLEDATIEELPDPDLSDLDEESKDSLKKVFSYVKAALDIRLKPLQEQMSKVSQYVEVSEGSKVKEEIASVRKKFSDFDDYRQDMVDINKVNPGLSVEELYFLAKTRKTGGFNVGAPKTDSERPQRSTARPAVVEKKPVRPGKRGFDDLLNEALDSIVK